jgi:hypothetical protein
MGPVGYAQPLYTALTLSFVGLYLFVYFLIYLWFIQEQYEYFRILSIDYLLDADHSGGAVLGMNRLCPLEHWDSRFESHSRHGCLCAFILCLSCPVCRQRPCDGLIPSPRRRTDCI